MILSGPSDFQPHGYLRGMRLFDFATPLKLNGQVAGYVRVGLDRGASEQILSENERQIFILAALVMVIMLLSMWFLYQSQNRHITRIVEMERRLEKAERLSALGKLAAAWPMRSATP
jgi:uncharacterized membrane protein affecting hemolysin expression